MTDLEKAKLQTKKVDKEPESEKEEGQISSDEEGEIEQDQQQSKHETTSVPLSAGQKRSINELGYYGQEYSQYHDNYGHYPTNAESSWDRKRRREDYRDLDRREHSLHRPRGGEAHSQSQRHQDDRHSSSSYFQNVSMNLNLHDTKPPSLDQMGFPSWRSPPPAPAHPSIDEYAQSPSLTAWNDEKQHQMYRELEGESYEPTGNVDGVNEQLVSSRPASTEGTTMSRNLPAPDKSKPLMKSAHQQRDARDSRSPQPTSSLPGSQPKSAVSNSSSSKKREIIPIKDFNGCLSLNGFISEKKIGEGTFGEVHICRHRATGKSVALKRILLQNEREGIPITAIREIKVLKSLKHENVIGLNGMVFEPGNRITRELGGIYMVFPYMDHDLAGLLENRNVGLGRDGMKALMQQLLEGILCMHTNRLIHRDIKSANILVDNYGRLKVADFGLARALPDNHASSLTPGVVTRWYRPPELLLGERQYTQAVDLWGIGCIFGEMMKRRPILTGTSELDQLSRIFDICGSPEWKGQWLDYVKCPDAKMVARDDNRGRCIRERFRKVTDVSPNGMVINYDMDEEGLDLLDRLLELDPKKRITAANATGHSWFFMDPLPRSLGPTFWGAVPIEASHELGSRLRGKKV